MRPFEPSAPVLVGWGAALGLLALGALLEPVARATSPRLAVALASGFGRDVELRTWAGRVYDVVSRPDEHYHAAGRLQVDAPWDSPERVRDPWGRPWRLRTHARSRWATHGVFAAGGSVYSLGPDGRDDEGQGDDVLVRDVELLDRGLVPQALVGRVCASFVASGAALLAWTTLLWLAVPAARSSTRVEALRAAALALPWSLVATAWTVAVARTQVGASWARHVEGALALRTPAAVAVVGTVTLASVALALAWRLSRPRAEEPAP